MTSSIRYSLTETDYLEFQMYTTLLIPSHCQQRFRTLLLPILLGALLGFFAFIRGETTMSACLLFYCGLWFIFNKKYTHWRFTQHFKKQIHKMEGSNIGVEATLSLDATGLNSQELNLGGTAQFASIQSITEIKSLYLVNLENTNSIMIPKDGIISGELDAFIQTLSQQSTRPITNDSTRPWK